MAFVKISEFPILNAAVSPLTAGDVIPIVHGPTTYKVQLSSLQEYFNLGVDLSAAGDSGWVQINVDGNLQAYPGFVYLPALSSMQIGYDNLQTGLYGGILGGKNNTNNYNNTFIVGSDIQAFADDYTLAKNLSAMYKSYAGDDASSTQWHQAFVYTNSQSARLQQPSLDARYGNLSGYSNITPLANIVAINLDRNTTFNVTLTSNVNSFTVSNLLENKVNSFALFLTQDTIGNKLVNFTFTGKTVKWGGGNVPLMTSGANATDFYMFVTNDGGSTWYGSVMGQNFS